MKMCVLDETKICDNCGEVFTINECEVIDGEKLEEVIEIK